MYDDIFSPQPEAPALVIGAAGIDFVGRLRNDLVAQSSNPALIHTFFGGVARNVAENLARLGHPVKLLTAVGADAVGDQLLAHAVDAGVNVDHVIRNTNQPTGSYLAIIGQRGGLQFALDDMRSMAAITPGFLRSQEALFKSASVLFLDANLPKESLKTAISLARRAKLPICADPTAPLLAHRFKPYLRDIEIFTPNSVEAGLLADCSIDPSQPMQALEAGKCLISQGVKIVIITLAEFGVSYATSETSGQIPAIHTEVVDPTGAGDALTAAVMFALLNDIPIDDAVRLGVSSATLTLQCPLSVVPDLSLQKVYDQLVI